LGLTHLIEIDVDPIDIGTEPPELLDVHAEPAADIKDALVVQGNVLAYEVEAAVLAPPPHIAGMAQGDGLVFDQGKDLQETDSQPKSAGIGLCLMLTQASYQMDGGFTRSEK